MQRRFAIVASLCLALSFAAMPAAAAPVTVSPIIGVRGFEFASVPLGTTEFQTMQGCPEFLGLGTGYLCVPYLITPTYAAGVFSVDLTFRNTAGVSSPIDASLFSLGALSDFKVMTQLDQYTVRLSGGLGSLGEMLCGTANPSNFSNPGVTSCVPGYDAIVFLGGNTQLPAGPYQVAMTAVNVPEPGTMALMGLGVLVSGHRLRRRKV